MLPRFGDLRRFSINTVTLRKQGNLLQIAEACARHGIAAISPWRDQVAEIGVKRTARTLRDSGQVVPGYCRAGMFVADSANRGLVREDNRRALEEAVLLDAKSLVVVVGGLPQFSRPGSAPSKNLAAARAIVAEELSYLHDEAKLAGMKLALEPLHPMHAGERGCINSTRQALDLCDALDPERAGTIGLALDVYHVWWDPELKEQIDRAGGDRIHVFHVCDWLAPTMHMLTDRGMMGDGIIDIRGIRRWVEDAGYNGHTEAEILSNRWWQRPMDDVITACVERYLRDV